MSTVFCLSNKLYTVLQIHRDLFALSRNQYHGKKDKIYQTAFTEEKMKLRDCKFCQGNEN